MAWRINLRRCARAYVDAVNHAPNTTIRFTNNTASAELLLVWDIGAGIEISNPEFVAYSQGAPFATTVTAQTFVPQEPVLPGVVSHGSLPSAITPIWAIPAGSGIVSTLNRTNPFAVLLPGWSLDIQNDGAGAANIGLQIMWEAILPAYFDLIYGSYERLTTGSGALP